MAGAEVQPVRGTHDLIGEDMRRHRLVAETARRIAHGYGFDEWQTPIFEHTEVFSRSIGEATDVVSKEMYSFPDRGGEALTLRPEGTASICRALISHGLTQSLPQRVFYAGPMFRYERPQKGRARQFHQVGVELIGPSEPLADAEAIALGRDVLAALGLARAVTIEVNTLGDVASREAWRAALVGHFERHAGSLSNDSRARLVRNPLRILDSKDAADRALVADAPAIEPFLTEAARAHWDAVRAHLGTLEVPFVVNPRIVRGLDYYSHTAFEFTTDLLGAQGTVLAGGRYDGLVAALGGPPVAAIGWAAGIERLAMLVGQEAGTPETIAVIPLGEAAEADALRLLQRIRRAGMRAEIGYRGNLRRRMERANRVAAVAAVIIGEDEQARGVAGIRLLATGAQVEVAFDEVPRHLVAALAGRG